MFKRKLNNYLSKHDPPSSSARKRDWVLALCDQGRPSSSGLLQRPGQADGRSQLRLPMTLRPPSHAWPCRPNAPILSGVLLKLVLGARRNLWGPPSLPALAFSFAARLAL